MRYFPQHVLLCTSTVHNQSANIYIQGHLRILWIRNTKSSKKDWICLMFKIVQGYPQRMRLQRRLYRIYTVCFLNLIFSKYFFFQGNNVSPDRSLQVTLRSWCFMRSLLYIMRSLSSIFRSSLKSHPFWLTLYICSTFYTMGSIKLWKGRRLSCGKEDD